MKASREIRDLVLGFVHDFANADPNLAELFSKSDATVFIGTDPAEFITGGREARALLAKQVDDIGKLKRDPVLPLDRAGQVEGRDLNIADDARSSMTVLSADRR